MQNKLFILCVTSFFQLAFAEANANGTLDYGFEFIIERSALEGLSLGDDPAEDRLVEEEVELEFKIEYSVSNDFYLFFTGALINETETVETENEEEKTSGLERKEMGLGYFFGESVQSEFTLGRMEFASTSEWFLWWDEELDGIRLKSSFGDFETMLALAEEFARESTDDDFIDPELKDIQRTMLSLDWEFADDNSLIFYYLDQTDDSKSFNVGEFANAENTDEEDADLRWSGISYLGYFEVDSIGEFEIELHTARVSGDETVYEFEDASAGRSEVTEREQNRVSGTAQSYLLSWTPSVLENWRFVLGSARGSGDSNPDDNRIKSFRQTGLQDDTEALGALYLPELSNLVVDVVGVSWQVVEGVEVSLLGFDYQQRKLAGEMRDVSIELDPTGLSRDLGSEIDLVITIETDDGLEFIITAAEFDPGKAYGSSADETSNFINIELAYEF